MDEWGQYWVQWICAAGEGCESDGGHGENEEDGGQGGQAVVAAPGSFWSQKALTHHLGWIGPSHHAIARCMSEIAKGRRIHKA